jgi:hypothetical protein
MAKVFWSPGVSTQIESPEKIVSQKRMRWGLEVTQKGATKNKFHLGIPCESRTHYVGGTPVSKFIFRFKLNKNAVVTRLHLGDGYSMVAQKQVNYTDAEIFDRFTPAKKYDWMAFTTSASGIILTIYVEFLAGDPPGKIIIYGAGVEVDPS